MKRAEKPPSYLFCRGRGIFLYRRVVPKELRRLAGRREFKESLRTRDYDQALERYPAVHARISQIFSDLQQGKAYNPNTPAPIEVLEQEAAARGLKYLPAEELFNDTTELIRRYYSWSGDGKPRGASLQAYFGAQPKVLTLEDALKFYEDSIKERYVHLNDRQKEKKRNPTDLGLRLFKAFLKQDIDFRAVTREQARAYKAYLQNRVVNGEITAGTANKLLGHVRKVFRANIEGRDLQGMPNPFAGLNLEETKRRRPAFTVEFLRMRWLAPDAFTNLKAECRGLLMVALDTGAHFSELCGLDPEQDIVLDRTIPYIVIRDNEHRKLKTEFRPREIPLIGNALTTMIAFPQGFSSYRRPGGSEAASALAMKYLRTHGLLETPDHKIYSLRHTFKDRLRQHHIPEELQNYFMGHRNKGMGSQYGSGYSPSQKVQYLRHLESDWS